MIFHTLHAHPGRFTVLDKTASEDTRLSWKAKGVHTYLMGKPNDWKVIREDLVNRSSDGVDAVKSAMQELKDFGYAELVTVQDEGGRIAGKRWFVAATPDVLREHLGQVLGGNAKENTVGGKTHPTVNNSTDGGKNRRTGKPSDGKSTTTNNECTKNELTNTDLELFGEDDLAIKLPAKSEPGKVNAAVKESKTSETLYRHRETAEAIYAEYPKKCNKLAAVKEIVKAMKSYDSTFLMEKVKSYAICRLGKDPTYTANPDNFFRQGKFLDDENLWTETPRTLAMKAGQQQAAVRQPELSASERRLARTKQQVA